MFTTEMTQLFAVILARDKDHVTEALMREGVMQFLNTSELEAVEPQPLPDVSPAVSLAEVADLRKRIEGILQSVDIIPAPPQEADLSRYGAVDIEQARTQLSRLESEREGLRERQRSLQQEIMRLEDIQRQVDLYGTDLSGVKLPARQSMLTIKTGKLTAAGAARLDEGLRALPALRMTLGRTGEDRPSDHHLLIYMKRDRAQIDALLAQAGWTEVDLPKELLSADKNFPQHVAENLQRLAGQQRDLQRQVTTLVKQEAPQLQALWVKLRINELCARIQTHFTSSSRAVIFAGWLASSMRKRLSRTITEASEGRCYLHWSEAHSPDMIGRDIPVQFNNPKVMAPFQMLVSNFGIPQYGTIDPTPFVMPIYLVMFGLMFADVGQGAVLTVLGAIGAARLKGRESRQGLYQLMCLIIWCGVSSILFGALLGSYFGTALFAPLWFDFHGIVSGHHEEASIINNIYDVLAITIYFGIAVIFLGLIFNWINMIRTLHWRELVYDKAGLLAGWMYAGGICAAAYMVSHDYKALPPGDTLFGLVGLPALLMLTKEPLHLLLRERGRSEPKTNYLILSLNTLMEWVVELLEIFSGYLSNTLSFMRVAGLGIAHVCLMMSFFTLADMTSGVFSVIILILGNVLVIGLEGLSAGIQALRLNYYEFFTKFFHGTGKLYAPISLNSKQ